MRKQRQGDVPGEDATEGEALRVALDWGFDDGFLAIELDVLGQETLVVSASVRSFKHPLDTPREFLAQSESEVLGAIAQGVECLLEAEPHSDGGTQKEEGRYNVWSGIGELFEEGHPSKDVGIAARWIREYAAEDWSNDDADIEGHG